VQGNIIRETKEYISNIIERLAVFKTDLRHVNNSVEALRMELKPMSKPTAEDFKLLEPPVHRLVSCHDLFLRGAVLASTRVQEKLRVGVPGVRERHLAGVNGVDVGIAGEAQIWPLAARQATVGPDNVPRPDTKADFVAQAGPMKLVGIPLGAERCRLHDAKVCPV
jgi:hypothetical protein